MSLTLVGSIALDTVIAPAGKVEDVLGGTAVYASIAASHFIPPQVVGVIGDDFPGSGRELLLKHGVDLTGVQQEAGKTFRWGGEYAENFNDRTTLFTELNVFEHFKPELPHAYRQTDTLFLGNIHPALQSHVLDQTMGKPFVGMDTMNLWINTALEELKQLIKRVDLIMVNDEESLMLTGERHYGKAAKALMAMGPEWIIIKKGSHGALLFHKDRIFLAPGLILEEIIDPTGAGDSFGGGLMGALAAAGEINFETMRRAVIQGSVMASFCVEGFSVNAMSDLKQEDLEARYQQFVEFVKF